MGRISSVLPNIAKPNCQMQSREGRSRWAPRRGHTTYTYTVSSQATDSPPARPPVPPVPVPPPIPPGHGRKKDRPALLVHTQVVSSIHERAQASSWKKQLLLTGFKRWGEVDDETRQYCKMMADMELVKYKEDMESYNVYKGRLEAIGEIPQDMKDRLAKKKRAADRKQGGAAGGGRASSSASPPSGPPPLPKPTRKSARRAAAVRADRVISRFVAPKISVPPSRRAAEPIAAEAVQSSPGAGREASDMEAFISSIVNDGGTGAAAAVAQTAGPASSPAATTSAAAAAGRLVTPDRQGA
ncbi:hypothetical protein THAOC_07248, partial [Thalassiosira oceanica]